MIFIFKIWASRGPAIWDAPCVEAGGREMRLRMGKGFPHSGKFLSFVGGLACVPSLSWLVPSYPVFSHCIHLLNKWKLMEINLILNYLLFGILLYPMNGWQFSGVSQTRRCRTEWNQLTVCSMRSTITWWGSKAWLIFKKGFPLLSGPQSLWIGKINSVFYWDPRGFSSKFIKVRPQKIAFHFCSRELSGQVSILYVRNLK